MGLGGGGRSSLVWCAHIHRATHGHFRLPLLSTRTGLCRRGAATGRRCSGSARVRSSSKTLQRMETRREEDRRVPRNVGARVSNFSGRGEGHEGARGALTTQPGAGLGARGSALLLLLRAILATGSLGFPLTCPGDAAGGPSWGGGAGRRHAPRRPRRSRSGPAVTRGPRPTRGHRPGRRARFRPGGALRQARQLSALCPWLAAVSLPSRSCSRTRPDARWPALPPCGLCGSAPRLASEVERCAPASDPG